MARTGAEHLVDTLGRAGVRHINGPAMTRAVDPEGRAARFNALEVHESTHDRRSIRRGGVHLTPDGVHGGRPPDPDHLTSNGTETAPKRTLRLPFRAIS